MIVHVISTSEQFFEIVKSYNLQITYIVCFKVDYKRLGFFDERKKRIKNGFMILWLTTEFFNFENKTHTSFTMQEVVHVLATGLTIHKTFQDMSFV